MWRGMARPGSARQGPFGAQWQEEERVRIILKLTGRTGLVMHNPRMIDPEDEIVRSIAEITAKGSKQTDADRQQVGRLEWFGGIYHDPEFGVYVPAWNVIKCINRGAVITKNGKDVLRSVSVLTDKVPLQYDGPREPAKLYERPEFRFRKEVGIGQKKVMRVRPIFRRWALALEAELLEEVMNPADLLRVTETAGLSEGLGDARILGYGRFGVELARA